jgi:Xaa-Pro aminopeptidase
MKNLLMVADSDHDANMLYATRMFVPDPFIYFRIRGRHLLVMSDLEIDRAKKQAAHCRVISLSQCQQKLRRAGRKNTGPAQVIRLLLKEHRVNKILVPGNFPLGLAMELRDLGVKVKPKPGSFFPERETKSADEVKKISAALMMAEVGLAEAMQAL